MKDINWQDEKAVEKWITDRFVEKDKMLDQFYADKGKEEKGKRGSIMNDDDIIFFAGSFL